ncbi:MAG: hypothetical protein AB8F74_15445 [Saprospiraceae bacterium]
MKPIVPILGIASIAWLFLGSLWMSNQVCSANNASTFTINDGKFNIAPTELFTFLVNSDQMQYNTETTGKALKTVSGYLADDSEKQLILTGLYGANEKNNTAYNDLGIARAETMKEFLVVNGANPENIKATSMKSANLVFNEENLMYGGVNFLFFGGDNGTSTSDNNTSTESSDSDASTGKETMTFAPGSSMFLDVTEINNNFTKTESFKNYFEGLKSYLEGNSERKLILTCFNDDSGLATTITRKVKSAFRNLGLSTTTITRKTAKVADSPNGIAGVTVVIQ